MTRKDSVFERNSVKTLAAVLLLCAVFLDFFGSYFWEMKRLLALVPKIPISGEQDLYLHHGLKKNIHMNIMWGKMEYPIFTNSLGFKDSANRKVPMSGRPGTQRLLILGDSFTEGIGMPYEVTFAGLLGKLLAPGTEVLNGGVSSYSPMLYNLKLSRLLGDYGLKVDKVLVMIDISDIQDEIIYQKDFIPSKERRPLWHAARFLRNNSMIFAYFAKKRDKAQDAAAPRRAIWPTDTLLHQERGIWDEDDAIYKKWGADGLALAGRHMAEAAQLCRQQGVKLSIGVYPWAEQISGRRLKSKQVLFWREFAKKERVGFVDLFPYFINKIPTEKILSMYFIPGDVHWNEAGHALVARGIMNNMEK